MADDIQTPGPARAEVGAAADYASRAAELKEMGLDDNATLALLKGTGNAGEIPSDDELALIVAKAVGLMTGQSAGNTAANRIMAANRSGVPVLIEPDPILQEARKMFGVPDLEQAPKNRNMTVAELVVLMMNDPNVKDSLVYDECRSTMMRIGPLPGVQSEGEEPLDDQREAQLYGYCQFAYGAPNKKMFETALDMLAGFDEYRRDPVKEMFTKGDLPLIVDSEDGRPIISWDPGDTPFEERHWEYFEPVRGTLYTKHLDAEDTPYTRRVEETLFRQIVGRAFFHGCNAPYIVVTEGEQGTGKSVFNLQLAFNQESLYIDKVKDFDVEFQKNIVGKLIVEFAELDVLKKANSDTAKSMITSRFDTVRFSYDHRSKDRLRTCVFVGTTNKKTFLSDNTGNRRYLIVHVDRPKEHTKPSVLEFDPSRPGLARDIRQAYAETVYELNKMGKEAFLQTINLPEDMLAEAEAVCERYTQEDQVTCDVKTYVGGLNQGERVNVKRAAMEMYDLDLSGFKRLAKYELGDIEEALNRCPELERTGKPQRVYNKGTNYGNNAKTWVKRRPSPAP